MTVVCRVILIASLIAAIPAHAQTFRLSGFLTARGVYTRSQRSWLEGGFGRFETGARSATSSSLQNVDVLQAGADWTPVTWLDVHVGVQARHERASRSVKSAGLVDAFVAVRKQVGSNQLQLRAGQFFLATSRENRDNLWTSPYTISYSALNKWIGEEFRPIGAELEWRRARANFDEVTIAGGLFRGNDTTGTLLGWRGWSIGDRLSVYGDVLPLPPLFSLEDEFEDQRDGTVPFQRDLDGRTGYTARVRYQRPERGSVQFTRVDNRGDREEYPSGEGIEYAWQTRFNIFGADVKSDRGTTLAAEYCWGTTGMGFRPRATVDLSFYTWYVLLSQPFGRNRVSARFDVFQTADRDHGAETNSENGRAWTFAWFYDLRPSIRAGLEFANISAARRAAEESGFDPNTDGRSLTLEIRYRF
jgi:hypothetical protein